MVPVAATLLHVEFTQATPGVITSAPHGLSLPGCAIATEKAAARKGVSSSLQRERTDERVEDRFMGSLFAGGGHKLVGLRMCCDP